jgi:adenylate cyclase
MGATYEIGPFRLDVEAKAITYAGAPVALGPRAVSVLSVLVESANDYVSKSRLVDEAWPGLVVEESNLTVQISAIRQALARVPGGERWIETLARRGYRFVGPLRPLPHPASGAADLTGPPPNLPSGTYAAEESNPPLALPDKPSIAVLPFVNMSGDAGQEYFADGMTEEIITALSRIKWLFVIARTSSFTYKGKSIDVKEMGRELGVRYVLEGSVRKADQRVRITAQLIDAVSAAHLSAHRFDGSLEDVFELQDKVAISVAAVIEPELIDAEIRRALEAPTKDLTAYDLYLRALPLVHNADKDSHVAALELIGEAIERKPDYGRALALAAHLHMTISVNGWGQDPDANRRSGVDLARRALRVAGDDPFVLAGPAYVLAIFGGEIDASLELTDRALTLNPSFARAWVNSGWLRLWAEHPDIELAISHFETASRLSPRDRATGAFLAMGVAHFFAHRFEDAVKMLLRSLQQQPNWPPAHRFLASCYAHMGRIDDAREAVEKLRTLTTVVVPNASHWRNKEFREFFLAGLRSASSEETPSAMPASDAGQ